MIAQHFIRSPSVRQKLEDRYAGIELMSGILIAILIILIIFILSSMTGFLSFIIVLVLITLLALFVGLGIWAFERKRRMISESISLPLSVEDMKVMGLTYRPMTPTTPSLQPYYSSHDSNSMNNHSFLKY